MLVMYFENITDMMKTFNFRGGFIDFVFNNKSNWEVKTNEFLEKFFAPVEAMVETWNVAYFYFSGGRLIVCDEPTCNSNWRLLAIEGKTPIEKVENLKKGIANRSVKGMSVAVVAA